MISLKKGFLFLHYPKTGGNSLQGVLSDYSEDKIVCLNSAHDGYSRFEILGRYKGISKHSTLLQYKAVIPAKIFDSLFKFTCIRNPWERMISFYFSPHRKKSNWDRDEFVALLQSVSPLRDFVTLNKSDSLMTHIDSIIRFECIAEDFDAICERLEIPSVPLIRRNMSVRKHYRSYYDNDLKCMVESKFKEEIDYGQYEF